MSAVIRKSELGRIKSLTAREMYLDSKSDDARITVKPEYQEIHEKMMRNRFQIVYTVDLNGTNMYGNEKLSEIKDFLTKACDSKCQGYWALDIKCHPTDEVDASGKMKANYERVRWKLVLMFEEESDLKLFESEQVLITKLTF